MQDNVFDPGECNVAECLVKELLEYYQARKIHVLDAHFADKAWIKKYPINNIVSLKILKAAVTKKYPDAVFLAPDCGGQKRTGLTGLDKKRINSHSIEIENGESLKKLVAGKIIGVVDDIIETGGTMERFASECRRYGAKKLIAVLTHGVLPSGIKRVKKTYDGLYLTNSIQRPESNVNVADLLIEKIKL
jgi:ribose-phosphate pyrophosphokinase